MVDSEASDGHGPDDAPAAGAVAAALHPREAERLEALHALRVLDRAPSERFDRITTLAARVFAVPTALVSLVDENRQWFLSRCGLEEATETGRDVAFCSHALHEEVMLVIEDAREDPRFATNPLVTGAPFIRFYAGVVLRDRAGLPLGTLCVIASEPRPFPACDRETLRQFGQLVASELLPDDAGFSERVHARLDARIDPMTNAQAAPRFLTELDRRLERDPPSRTGVALVVLSSLEQVNEIFGRGIGDELVATIAERLAHVGTGFDAHAIGRLGGRRLALAVTDATFEHDRRSLGERLERALGELVQSAGGTLSPDLEIGIAYGEPGASTAAALLERCRASTTMTSPARGVRVTLYDQRAQRPVHRRLRIAAELGGAIERGDFELFYQPKIGCESGLIDGFECLLRWRHEALGDVSPLDVVAAAEGINLSVALDRWVIDTALAQLARWREAALPTGVVSVNVTGTTLLWPELVPWLDERLAHHGIAPGELELEVLESSVFEDFEAIVAALDRVRERGILLSLDDFGTGYSSLAYLRHLPVSVLKIDRSFVASLEKDPIDVALCVGILTMARSLGLSVVAEGVENEHQFDILRSHRCDRVQGYHFSRPVPFEEATRMLEAQAFDTPRLAA